MSLPIIKDVAGLMEFMKSTNKVFDRVLDNAKILSVGDGNCSAELKVTEEHTNVMGGLHGGLLATLVDTISSFALASKLNGNVHVSIDIHVSYLKGAKIGDRILIEAVTLKSGKSLAFLEVLIKNKETGDLLAKASHTKFIMPK